MYYLRGISWMSCFIYKGNDSDGNESDGTEEGETIRRFRLCLIEGYEN